MNDCPPGRAPPLAGARFAFVAGAGLGARTLLKGKKLTKRCIAPTIEYSSAAAGVHKNKESASAVAPTFGPVPIEPPDPLIMGWFLPPNLGQFHAEPAGPAEVRRSMGE